MNRTFSLKKRQGKWVLSVEHGKLRIHNTYTTWEEAMQKINEILESWKES